MYLILALAPALELEVLGLAVPRTGTAALKYEFLWRPDRLALRGCCSPAAASTPVPRPPLVLAAGGLADELGGAESAEELARATGKGLGLGCDLGDVLPACCILFQFFVIAAGFAALFAVGRGRGAALAGFHGARRLVRRLAARDAELAREHGREFLSVEEDGGFNGVAVLRVFVSDGEGLFARKMNSRKIGHRRIPCLRG